VWPSSCVSTSATLVAPQHEPTFWFIVRSPSTMRWYVVPFTIMVAPEEQ
jgi:hypothetical protein